jgi:hypothetical protein
MSISKKVRAVEKVFHTLDKEIADFQKISKLKCAGNCNLCCNKTDIYANLLEFMPLAYHLYQNHQAYDLLEKLENNQHNSVCILNNPFNEDGACTYYYYRGLICRLFGFSASIDKYGNKVLITCKTTKIQQAQEYQNTLIQINKSLKVPLTSNYYAKLYAIDLKLSSSYYPINEAIQKALETVLFYFSFTNKRAV